MKVDLEKLERFLNRVQGADGYLSGQENIDIIKQLPSLIRELTAARAVVEAAKAIMNDETLHKWVTLEDVIKRYEEVTNL